MEEASGKLELLNLKNSISVQGCAELYIYVCST